VYAESGSPSRADRSGHSVVRLFQVDLSDRLSPIATQMGHLGPFGYLVGMDAMPSVADEDLAGIVATAATGDDFAFARIVDAYHDDMRRVCAFITRDMSLAEDAVQTAWSIVWRKLGSMREPARLRSWLMRVAVNEAKKSLRDRGRRIAVESLTVGRGAPVGVDPETGIDALDLRKALARLDADDRALLAMRYVAGFNATELADVVGITPSGVRNRLERLTARLRQDLTHG
jgi:RNA polymerase sigma-70 factor (ECF subfamily)